MLRWAHPGLGRNPRYRHNIEEQRRLAEGYIKKIQAEQERRNAVLRRIDRSQIGLLRLAARYSAGRPRTLRRQ